MIAFLDFDGVLHPAFVYLKDGKPSLSADGELFMWAPLLVEALAPYPEIRIVLSTSWVHVIGYDDSRNALPESLRQRVIGATWHAALDSSPYASQTDTLLGWNQMTRYEQISLYANRVGVNHWLAIDDDHYGWKSEDKGRLIQTDPELGISEIVVFERFKKALAVLAQATPNNGIKP